MSGKVVDGHIYADYERGVFVLVCGRCEKEEAIPMADLKKHQEKGLAGLHKCKGKDAQA